MLKYENEHTILSSLIHHLKDGEDKFVAV